MTGMTAAEKTTALHPGERLKFPWLAVLSKAAYVVLWREFPDGDSHYGSCGIIVFTFFKSYSQGIEAYGEKGMSKLWRAANICVAGTGLSDDKFLPFLPQMIGEHDVPRRTTDPQKCGRLVSTHLPCERLLKISDLAAFPEAERCSPAPAHPRG